MKASARAARAEDWIRREKIIAILRVGDADQAIRFCHDLVTAGLSALKLFPCGGLSP